MTTDKTPATLATVKHGGCVQLGDGLLRNRTPADYAIEHAGYLATAAQRLLDARDELDALVMRREEEDDVDDGDMHAAQEFVDEASTGVRSAIYDFEKRRDRALAARQPVGWQPMETAPKNGTEILIEVEWRAGIRGKCLVGHYMAGGHCIEDHPPIDAGWYFWNGIMFDRAAKPVRWMHIQPAQAVDLSMLIAKIDQAWGYLSTALDDLDSSPDRRPSVMVDEAMGCLRQALTGVPHG